MGSIRVLMVDDHQMFLDGMTAILEKVSDLVIVGEALSGEEAIGAVQELLPGVVLMDIVLPGIDGIESSRRILEMYPKTAIIVLTALHAEIQVFRALKAGVRGYLCKDTGAVEIVRAIRMVAKGSVFVDPAVVGCVLQEFVQLWQEPTVESIDRLTKREIEILKRIADGASNKEIGAELYLAEKTVKNAVRVIFQKLGLTDRAQAAAYAVRHKLVEDRQR